MLVFSAKPIDGGHRARMRESVAQATPILANQRNLALAETRAASDALTGLPNRSAANDTLNRIAAQAGRSISPLAAIMLDLVHFKAINDRRGHENGDRALALVGYTISSTIRRSDFAARFGGEEFLILLPTQTAKAPSPSRKGCAPQSKTRSSRASARSPRASASPCSPRTPATPPNSSEQPTAPSTPPKKRPQPRPHQPSHNDSEAALRAAECWARRLRVGSPSERSYA